MEQRFQDNLVDPLRLIHPITGGDSYHGFIR